LLDISALGAAMLQSARLWGEDQNPEALKILDEWIARAERENETAWVDILCGQASMIAGEMDDLRLTRQYCEKVLSHENETALTQAMAHYRLANSMFRHGEVDLGKQHAARAHALVAHPTKDEERGLLELLIRVWPEISDWKG
jgi:hypothetical protein